MKTFTIHNKKTHKPLFSGAFETIKDCVESAINKGLHLEDANLKHMNLAGANLDDAHLNGADFSFSNLSGANISESQLKNTIWRGTSLYNTCLAYSNLTAADLRFSGVGATDISQANLTNAIFCLHDASKINFSESGIMTDCIFENNAKTRHISSTPPIVITGINDCPIFILNKHIFFKNRQLKVDNFNRELKRKIF